MDTIDRVTETETKIFERQIEGIRNRVTTLRRKPTGKCQYCGEDLEDSKNKIFCDKECLEDNLKYNK